VPANRVGAHAGWRRILNNIINQKPPSDNILPHLRTWADLQDNADGLEQLQAVQTLPDNDLPNLPTWEEINDPVRQARLAAEYQAKLALKPQRTLPDFPSYRVAWERLQAKHRVLRDASYIPIPTSKEIQHLVALLLDPRARAILIGLLAEMLAPAMAEIAQAVNKEVRRG
jgi:hypothetical protein